ncbi:RNA-binding cell elongation regulator Jag/EloR [Metabacillus malikii]|uniref:RNA-binding protein KhpB n=1 Tax=Metabacillus malikii TaxID=1504265 RepID=A0ABT9ZLM1_9BACI|nr:RNA-binding cell elongation regulator Jag/EloR [Metabacillus malikii]MDQ0233184.1 spoIIIJ-associated protein [Metabacillus malikii]
MKEITAKGLTVNEAVTDALKSLNVTEDDVVVEVIDEGKKGILGIFGKKPAQVLVKVKEKDPIQEASLFLTNVVKKMGINARLSVKQRDKTVTFHLTGEKIAVLIGKRGQTLNSLQFLTQLVANRYSKQYIQIIVDAENYRDRRKETLKQLGLRVANQVIRTSKKVSLEPMPSNERKIIHAILAGNKNVKTYSIGEEPHRYLVVTPNEKSPL